MRFKCKFCRYSLEKETAPSACPYCSKARAMEEEESAENLIEEVE